MTGKKGKGEKRGPRSYLTEGIMTKKKKGRGRNSRSPLHHLYRGREGEATERLRKRKEILTLRKKGGKSFLLREICLRRKKKKKEKTPLDAPCFSVLLR